MAGDTGKIVSQQRVGVNAELAVRDVRVCLRGVCKFNCRYSLFDGVLGRAFLLIISYVANEHKHLHHGSHRLLLSEMLFIIVTLSALSISVKAQMNFIMLHNVALKITPPIG